MNNAQIHADPPLFLSALSPAGSHQAEMINYSPFGLFRQPAEPCWLLPSVHRRAALEQAPSPRCWELKPSQSHPSKERMAKCLKPLADCALHLMWHLTRGSVVCTSDARTLQAAFNCQQMGLGLCSSRQWVRKAHYSFRLYKFPTTWGTWTGLFFKKTQASNSWTIFS